MYCLEPWEIGVYAATLVLSWILIIASFVVIPGMMRRQEANLRNNHHIELQPRVIVTNTSLKVDDIKALLPRCSEEDLYQFETLLRAQQLQRTRRWLPTESRQWCLKNYGSILRHTILPLNRHGPNTLIGTCIVRSGGLRTLSNGFLRNGVLEWMCASKRELW